MKHDRDARISWEAAKRQTWEKLRPLRESIVAANREKSKAVKKKKKRRKRYPNETIRRHDS